MSGTVFGFCGREREDTSELDQRREVRIAPERSGSRNRSSVKRSGRALPRKSSQVTVNRGRDGPAAFLKDYRGFLQADAHGGYDGIFLGSDGGIVEVAWWADARRKFDEARSNASREANQVLVWAQQLYDIEDRARDLTPVERQMLRSTSRCRFSIGSRIMWTSCRGESCPSQTWGKR